MSQQKPASDAAQSSNFLAELRGGEGGGDAPLITSSMGRRKVNVQTLVVVGVIIASVGLLYAMRQHGMGAGMTFDKAIKIDYDWNKDSAVSVAHQNRVLADLARSEEPLVPPIEHLPKNPFVLELASSGPAETPEVTLPVDTGADARRAELNRQIREKEILSDLATLELHSVMGGRVPLARIGTRIYQIGDRVGDFFRVVAIHGRTVDLEADGKVYSLSIAEPEIEQP